PRKRGKALTGQLSGLWRYRIGNYRAICMIENNELVILVIDVDHRSTIYSKNY
ncbi:type II toxin-antitoxin system RelE/ParE family toxin, partial [Escherichia coli]|nr:type II toxin-antitoxin system RelE/ParE family toxin [Escherichia coli]